MSKATEVIFRILGDSTVGEAAIGSFSKNVDTLVDKVAKAAPAHERLGKAMTELGATAAGVGATLEHFAGPAEAAQKSLEVAIKNTGGSFEEFHRRIDDTVASQAKLGRNSADTEQALAKLTTASGSTSKALDDMKLASEIAAFKHESLADAASQVIKMHAGSTKAFKEFGVSLDSAKASITALTSATKEHESSGTALAKATEHLAEVHQRLDGVVDKSVAQQLELKHANEAVWDATEKHNAAAVRLMRAHQALADQTKLTGTAMDQVFNKVQGQAAAQADTFEGKIRALRATAENYAATLGAKVGPALTIAGPAMAGIGGVLQSNVIPTMAKAVVSTASWAASTVASGVSAAASFAVSVGEMIIQAGVWAATIVAEAATAVASWVASMAVMAASAIATGVAMLIPFLPVIAVIALVGVAAYELYTHWDTVFGFIKRIAADAWAGVVTGAEWVVAMFESVPRRLLDVGAGMFDFVKESFKAAINFVIRAWDSLHFKVPSLDLGPLGHFGGFDIGLPQIPQFAGGGTVPGPLGSAQLIIAHGGEQVLNSQQQMGGRGAGGIHIENVNAPNYYGDKHDLVAALVDGLAEFFYGGGALHDRRGNTLSPAGT